MRAIITEKQAISWGILKEGVSRGQFRTELSSENGQINFYNEDALESIKKLKQAGFDDIDIIGKIYVNWDFSYNKASFGLEDISMIVQSVEPFLKISYDAGDEYKEIPLDLDVTSFTGRAEVFVTGKGFYPNDIEIDLGRKDITIN